MDAIDVLARDKLWERVREEAETATRREPELAGFFERAIMVHDHLQDAVAERIASRLSDPQLPSSLIRNAFNDALDDEPSLIDVIRADILAVYERDPACERFIEPILYFKGFHAIAAHRIAKSLWDRDRRDLALLMQSRSSAAMQVDIHPAVPMGRGIFIDHATGVVIGATATVGDWVSILQGVTLGGTGKNKGDRHPKIGSGVLIGAGASILGNFEVGHCSRVAAGSVVLSPVPPNKTVAGVPARIVGEAGCPEPARSMDQILADLSQT